MAYVTIEKNGEPWMFCHSMHEADVERQTAMAQTETPDATFTHRQSTPVESQRCADAMDAQEGVVENPFTFFAVRVSDLPVQQE